MISVKKSYYIIQRYAYLLNKLLWSVVKPLVLYSKKHPIYTSLFEEIGLKEFTPVFIDLKQSTHNFLERIIINRVVLLHIDSATMPVTTYGKKIIVECEAKPYEHYFTNSNIEKILVESKNAGEGILEHPKVTLSYPSIQPKPYIVKSKTNDKTLTLLCVGHGGYIKGYDVLYRVYKQLSKEYNVKLIIAGSFGHNYDYYPEVMKESYERENFPLIQKQLIEDNNVIIKSFKRKVLLETIYPSADIYIQFSRMETFGYSILEAMSFGLPIVSCFFKAIPEMVEHGKNGYLVSSNGYNEVANDYKININSPQWGENCFNESIDYLRSLLSSAAEREKFGRHSVEIVREKFNLEHKQRSIEALYKDCIN